MDTKLNQCKHYGKKYAAHLPLKNIIFTAATGDSPGHTVLRRAGKQKNI